jgi:site-specific recombinase XerD
MRPSGVRAQLHRAAKAAGVRRRFAPHQPRHAHAVEMTREGIPLLASPAGPAALALAVAPATATI